MSHGVLDGTIEGLAFCPFEDVMGIGHSGGLTTILIPGGWARQWVCTSTSSSGRSLRLEFLFIAL